MKQMLRAYGRAKALPYIFRQATAGFIKLGSKLKRNFTISKNDRFFSALSVSLWLNFSLILLVAADASFDAIALIRES